MVVFNDQIYNHVFTVQSSNAQKNAPVCMHAYFTNTTTIPKDRKKARQSIKWEKKRE